MGNLLNIVALSVPSLYQNTLLRSLATVVLNACSAEISCSQKPPQSATACFERELDHSDPTLAMGHREAYVCTNAIDRAGFI